MYIITKSQFYALSIPKNSVNVIECYRPFITEEHLYICNEEIGPQIMTMFSADTLNYLGSISCRNNKIFGTIMIQLLS